MRYRVQKTEKSQRQALFPQLGVSQQDQTTHPWYIFRVARSVLCWFPDRWFSSCEPIWAEVSWYFLHYSWCLWLLQFFVPPFCRIPELCLMLVCVSASVSIICWRSISDTEVGPNLVTWNDQFKSWKIYSDTDKLLHKI